AGGANGATTALTKRDFASDQETRWCPGCGDYAILATVQQFLPELGTPPEKIVFVAGIGCSGRFAYYMSTYGVHGIPGRAPALVEIYQNCNVFNDGAFEAVRGKGREANQIRLRADEPIRFGADGERGVVRDAVGRPGVAEVAEVGEEALLVHDPHEPNPSQAFALAHLAERPAGPTPIGVFRDVERPVYGEETGRELAAARAPPPPARRRPRRERMRAPGDADVRAANAPLGHQRGDDPPRRGVDRDGEAETDPSERGVDADHPAAPVGERTPGAAGVERRVGLDHVVDEANGAPATGARRQRPPESG